MQHEGTSQQQRLLPQLKPSYAPIDDRGEASWIQFAARLSPYLDFYNEQDEPAGSWEPFFTTDLSAILGSIAIQDIASYKTALNERLDFLRGSKNEQNLPLLEETLGSIFSCLLSLGIALDKYLFKFPADEPAKLMLENSITRFLQPSLVKLLGWYKGGKLRRRKDGTVDNAMHIIRDKDFPDWKVLGQPVLSFKDQVATSSLSTIWLGGQVSLHKLYQSIEAEPGIYGEETNLPAKRIQHAANHNLFTGVADQFLAVYARFIKDAEKSLATSLTSFSNHQPHYALFLTFIRLYRLAQDELNTLTKKHLNFYYQDVLGLQPLSATGNRAHLLVVPSRNAETFVLPAGTLFKAGKDELGQEMHYALERETVISQAKVVSLKSLYHATALHINGKAATDNTGNINNEGRLYASPVANSVDGMGGEIKETVKSWHPFVPKTFEAGKLISIDSPKADIGFAVSSPVLMLAEGDRIIEVKLQLTTIPDPLPEIIKFRALLTSKKIWQEADVLTSWQYQMEGSENALLLTITLPANAEAITGFNTKVHGGFFEEEIPVMKLLLENTEESRYTYDFIDDLRIQSVTTTVWVGMSKLEVISDKAGIRQIFVGNEGGTLDSAKPFLPFGDEPKLGSSFMIGSEEFFKKKDAAFQLKLNWKDLPTTQSELPAPPTVNVQALTNAKWLTAASAIGLWNRKTDTFNISGRGTFSTDYYESLKLLPGLPLAFSGALSGAYIQPATPYTAYTNKSNHGFLRLVLNSSIGYEQWQIKWNKYLTDVVLRPTLAENPGPKPYVPKLESISLHYTATSSKVLGEKNGDSGKDSSLAFYHIHPFGEALVGLENTIADAPFLLPQFTKGDGETDQDSAELYIGISGLKASESINLLIGVQTGSADPLTQKPEKHLSWSYLSNNTWRPFDPRNINDGTAQLLQTGIITFAIPPDATTDNTLLSPGLLWLKVGVSAATAAVCKLLNVDAQAATVRYVNINNQEVAIGLPLAAGTISKLKVSNALVKTVSQPYPAFDGRPAESAEGYYKRNSERLRHKNRAITVWDYEHLLLEEFPELSRVKCLNHTAYQQLPNGSMMHNTNAPGHVTIISIPVLNVVSTTNLLRPYTSESVLTRMYAFLRKRMSCHIIPHVVHPLFEEVALDFQLRLSEGFEDYNFYIKQLKEELTEHLTPWVIRQDEPPAFGGSVLKSELINFIEERPYVDYITVVKLYHRTMEDPTSLADVDEVHASNAMAILVSVEANEHTIVQIPDAAIITDNKICKDPNQSRVIGNGDIQNM